MSILRSYSTEQYSCPVCESSNFLRSPESCEVLSSTKSCILRSLSSTKSCLYLVKFIFYEVLYFPWRLSSMKSCIPRLFLWGSDSSREYGKVRPLLGVPHFAGFWQSQACVRGPITSRLCENEESFRGPWQLVDRPAFLEGMGCLGVASTFSQSVTGFGSSCRFHGFTHTVIPMMMDDFLSFLVILEAAWKDLITPAVGNSWLCRRKK